MLGVGSGFEAQTKPISGVGDHPSAGDQGV